MCGPRAPSTPTPAPVAQMPTITDADSGEGFSSSFSRNRARRRAMQALNTRNTMLASGSLDSPSGFGGRGGNTLLGQ